MMRVILLLWVGLFTMSAAARADTTWVDGRQDLSGEWSRAGNPYMILGHAHIAPGDTLKIGPGVRVQFTGQYGLTVEGVLNVTGLETDSVCFTTDLATNPAGWFGIRLMSPSGGSHFSYAVIENGRALASGEYSYGGGLYAERATWDMDHCTVRGCRALSGQAISMAYQSVLTMSDCVVSGNGSLNGFGGGMYGRASSVLTLTRCTLEQNTAQYGGALALDACTVTLDHCLISKNFASVGGGGIFSSAATVIATHSTFLGNMSVGGGAIDGRYELYLTMDHCLLQSNVATRPGNQGPGGGLALAGGQQTISYSTFVNNAAGLGGGIWAGTSTQITGCIFAFQASGGGTYFPYTGAVVRNCCFGGNVDGDCLGMQLPSGLGGLAMINANGDSCDQFRNLFLDPLFDDTTAAPYQLTAHSPCINAGSTSSPHDPDGTVADIGAFYYDTHTAAAATFIPHPSSLILLSAYPNPFNPATSVCYEVAREGVVSLRVFDLLGRDVATLASGRRAAGTYTVMWNAEAAPAGTYFAVLQASGQTTVRKLLLLK